MNAGDARYYSPALGRFMTPDPAGLGVVASETAAPSAGVGYSAGPVWPGAATMRVRAVEDPQVWNAYAYTTGNPATLTDPAGLCGSPDPFTGGGAGGCDPFYDPTCTCSAEDIGPYCPCNAFDGTCPVEPPLIFAPLFRLLALRPPLATCHCSRSSALPGKNGRCGYSCACGVGLGFLFQNGSGESYPLAGMVPVDGCRKASNGGKVCPQYITSAKFNFEATSYALISCSATPVQ